MSSAEWQEQPTPGTGKIGERAQRTDVRVFTNGNAELAPVSVPEVTTRSLVSA